MSSPRVDGDPTLWGEVWFGAVVIQTARNKLSQLDTVDTDHGDTPNASVNVTKWLATRGRPS